MAIKERLARLELRAAEAARTARRSDVATVLVTDDDGANFLATAEGKGYGDGLVITAGIFADHKFCGGLTADDEAAIANLNNYYEPVAVYKIDGYHLRLIDQAYKAALTRDGWLPREKEAAAAANARGDRVTIINVTERKHERAPRGD